jgi:Transport and Golgi organisation 2
MCTVSWLHTDSGYLLLCNRDESVRRKPAGGPRQSRQSGVDFIAPVDGDYGGSWIAVNHFAVSICLLNRYGDIVESQPPSPYISRGLLVLELMDCLDSQSVRRRLLETDLTRFNPFSLIALQVGQPALIAEWTGRSCLLSQDHESPGTRSSSALKSPDVTAQRRRFFQEMLSRQSRPDADLLLDFHRSHEPARGPASVCMHRDDAATVSLSQIVVQSPAISFRYCPCAPCSGQLTEPVSLEQVSTTGRTRRSSRGV